MKLFSLLFFISLNAFAHDAIVYGGPGACPDGCIDAAVTVTRIAGFDPIVVTPDNFHPSVLESAKVWVQPGGKSGQASNAMGAEMKEHIKTFIKNGGGYVGFCAGAFLATKKVGTSSVTGLGIIPGTTKLYKSSPGHVSVQPVMLKSGPRQWYWEGGPRFTFSNEEFKSVNVTVRYQVGNYIGGVETTYGKGRVSVTGLHPEAPKWWFDDAHLIDSDGDDNQQAADMIKWAANI
jgi:glutamine amidotransferase-like uncharacterized protein